MEHIGTIIDKHVWNEESSVFIEEREGFWSARIQRTPSYLHAEFTVAGDSGRVTVLKDRLLADRSWTPVKVAWSSGGGDLDAALRMRLTLQDAERIAGIFEAEIAVRA